MFRLAVRRYFSWRAPINIHSRTLKNTPKPDPENQVDSVGLPIKPLWSVNELLSSYPKPELSSSSFQLLHELSALTPLEEGTLEYANLKRELEELVRLVEAVKLVDTEGVHPAELRPLLGDGAEEEIYDDEVTTASEAEMGRVLLKHASRTDNDFYVVEADRKR